MTESTQKNLSLIIFLFIVLVGLSIYLKGVNIDTNQIVDNAESNSNKVTANTYSIFNNK